jgi:glycosyltransferase involved in cell wall biosynthesis
MACDPSPCEILVVANGDTDGSRELAAAMGVRVLRSTTPLGPAAARNLGASEAVGDVLLFVDADVTVPPDAVGIVARAFEDDPDLAAVFGSYDDAPSEHDFFSQYRNLLHHYVHQTAREEASTFWTGCGAIRQDIFLASGGFDERYPRPSIEDIELGYRLRRSGHKIRLHKALQVKHLKRWSAVSMLETDVFCRALPWTELILSGGGVANDLNTSMASRASLLLVYTALVATAFAVWTPWSLAVAAALLGALVLLNAPLYRFFYSRRGAWFAARAVPCHWVYYLCGGLGFALGVARRLLQPRTRAAGARTSAAPARSSDGVHNEV